MGSCRGWWPTPAPLSAFAVGLLVFAPGVTFIAALQVIATARAGPDITVLAVILVVVINVLLAWLPITLHLVAPKATERRLKAFNHWLRAHGTTVLIGVLAVAEGSWSSTGFTGLSRTRLLRRRETRADRGVARICPHPWRMIPAASARQYSVPWTRSTGCARQANV